MQLRENGKYKRVYGEWEGQGDPGDSPAPDKLILTPGMVIILYFLMFSAFGAAMSVFVLEKFLFWFKSSAGVDVYGLGAAISEEIIHVQTFNQRPLRFVAKKGGLSDVAKVAAGHLPYSQEEDMFRAKSRRRKRVRKSDNAFTNGYEEKNGSKDSVADYLSRPFTP